MRINSFRKRCGHEPPSGQASRGNAGERTPAMPIVVGELSLSNFE
jgi:hypothetical protein